MHVAVDRVRQMFHLRDVSPSWNMFHLRFWEACPSSPPMWAAVPPVWATATPVMPSLTRPKDSHVFAGPWNLKFGTLVVYTIQEIMSPRMVSKEWISILPENVLTEVYGKQNFRVSMIFYWGVVSDRVRWNCLCARWFSTVFVVSSIVVPGSFGWRSPFRVDFMRAQLRFPRRTTSFRWNLVHTVLVNVLMFFIILVLQKYARLQKKLQYHAII